MSDGNYYQSLIIAVGLEKRMHSDTIKPLERICGTTLLDLVLNTLKESGFTTPRIVASPELMAELAPDDGLDTVVQPQRTGIAEAAEIGINGLSEGDVVVAYADAALVKPATVRRMVARHRSEGAKLTILTCATKYPRGLRIVRDSGGSPVKAVDINEADESGRGNEITVGWYCADIGWLKDNLRKAKESSTGEYRFSDLIEIAARRKVLRVTGCERSESYGVSNPKEMAYATKVLQRRINSDLAEKGVLIRDPDTAYIDGRVRIGVGTVVEPNMIIRGETAIGKNCRIGPNGYINNAKVDDDVVVGTSILNDCSIEKGSEIGGGAEIKRSTIGSNVRIKHFCYVGDSKIGNEVNIGAGTATCNYDGANKHPTRIGDGAFIGAGTLLIAPIEVGNNARTAAGAVVTHDVAPFTLVKGVPARVSESKKVL